MKPNDVSDEEFAIIRAKAEAEWADDFEMQAHVIEEQIKALRRLRAGCPADISEKDFATIRAKAASEWPDDFEMRLHVEEEQCAALRRLGRTRNNADAGVTDGGAIDDDAVFAMVSRAVHEAFPDRAAAILARVEAWRRP